MLCKTAVARRVLLHAWTGGAQMGCADLYLIDAKAHFGAAVDACLLVCDFQPSTTIRECSIHSEIKESRTGEFGLRDSRLVADLSAYERRQSLKGQSDRFRWRSGIKHDCAEIVELQKEGQAYRNGLGECVELEEEYLYPMLKSSDLANGPIGSPRRWMLVTQTSTGQDTAGIQARAPRTWEYLNRHIERFRRRASAIYKRRPEFSIFGVGNYSFMPWKVAVSAFHKNLEFKVIGPAHGKPVVFDDTCYFLACKCREEAEHLHRLVSSEAAREFYNSLIFWDAKRPVTIDILSQLRLEALEHGLPFLN